jgi:hypothetical protein
MAIVIPQENIFNYEFNILNNNAIKKVSIPINNFYNWKVETFTADRNGIDYTTFPSYFYSSDDRFVFYDSTQTLNTSQRTVYFGEKTRAATKQRFSVKGYFDYRNIVVALDSKIEDNILKVTDNITYSIQNQQTGVWTHGHTKEIELPIYYNDNLPNGVADPGFDVEGSVTFEKNLGSFAYLKFSITLPSYEWYWEDYEKSFMIEVISHSITIELKPHYKQIKLSTTGSKDDPFELKESPFINFSTSTDSQSLYDAIFENIIEQYKNSKMTLEIETRYTTFKNEDGSYANEGKPYLIKVGDVVKPQMTSKFSNFEYEYIVTSVEYEYDGSDKVYLKLLQK